MFDFFGCMDDKNIEEIEDIEDSDKSKKGKGFSLFGFLKSDKKDKKKQKKEEEKRRRREEEEKNNQKEEEEMRKIIGNIYNDNNKCNSNSDYNFNNYGNSINLSNQNYQCNFNDNSNQMFMNSQLSSPSSFKDTFPSNNNNYPIDYCYDEVIKEKLNELALQKERNRLEIEEARRKNEEEINQINEAHKK